MPCLRSPLVGMSLDELAEIPPWPARRGHFWFALNQGPKVSPQSSVPKETGAGKRLGSFGAVLTGWVNSRNNPRSRNWALKLHLDAKTMLWKRLAGPIAIRAAAKQTFMRNVQTDFLKTSREKFDQFTAGARLFRFLKYRAQREGGSEPEFGPSWTKKMPFAD